MPVVGCSAYFYSRKALGLPADVTASEVKQAARHFCQSSTEELAKELPKDKYRSASFELVRLISIISGMGIASRPCTSTTC